MSPFFSEPASLPALPLFPEKGIPKAPDFRQVTLQGLRLVTVMAPVFLTAASQQQPDSVALTWSI